MDATTYTGTGGAANVTNQTGFKPDLVWVKSRSNAYLHILVDSVRGVSKYISSNSTDAEVNDPGAQVTAFNSNGFTQAGNQAVGGNGSTFVGWQWQAGQGTTSSNTSGSVSSTVSVNATAGFSIVSYTLTSASVQTIGHGLGVAPSLYIVKIRNTNGTDWYVYHSSSGAGNYLKLNTTAASTSDSGQWNNTAPTSSVFTLGSSWAAAGYPMITYCWAPVAGFSAFGSYTGNGSSDGPFVYTGFRPSFIMIKRASGGAGSWAMFDTSRSPYNVTNIELAANESSSEYTRAEANMDILSNGFKLRNTDGWHNGSGDYIYMAFAENPFKFSNAR
jgi:hypothetical protein